MLRAFTRLLRFAVLAALLACPGAGADAPLRGRTQNYQLRVVPSPGDVQIDGRLDEWDRSGRIFLCADLERQKDRQYAEAMAMYDAEALYVAMDVGDPTPLRNDVDPDVTPDEGWRGDCLQLRLRMPAPEAGGEPQVLLLDSWLYRTGNRAALQLTKAGPERGRVDLLKQGGRAALREREDGAGYVMELRVPWDALGAGGRAAAGLDFGMGIELIGGPGGDEDEAFRLIDLVAVRGTDTNLFYMYPGRWGRARLVPEGDLTVSTCETMPVAVPEHPFLICKRADFPELRQRAAREPWKTMKADAMRRVAAGPPESREPIPLQSYVGACALTYIVDEGSEPAHARRVHEAITAGLKAVTFDPALKAKGTVPPMGAAFACILALDVVYDDLSADQVRECEAVIEEQIGKISRIGSWTAGRRGTHGTWDIYRGERILPDDEYYANYVRQMTPDGVSTVSPVYAMSRLGSADSRPQKSGYADVLEFTGIDRRYYDDPRLTNFYRWLFSASVTPAREYHMFGDVAPVWRPGNSALFWRVGRFDERAAAYAAWLLEGRSPPGHILSYVLMQQPLPEAVVPQSRLFMKGEAVFREPEDSPLSLGAALYNITESPDWHAHEEVNAISLAAYGARLVVNGGWLGEDMRPPWKNNTLAVDAQPHKRRTGAGLTEGLLADGFDYACGDSGQALGNDAFRRSLVLVHGRADAGGYFVVFDEVDADAGERVHAYLQTASESEAREVGPRREYVASIDHHSRVDGVAMTVFDATEPVDVRQERVESGFLPRTAQSGHHNRLEAVYETDEAGDRRIVTVCFPHDAAHPPAVLARAAADGCTGATVTFPGGASDLILESDGARSVDADGLRLRARAVIVRRHAKAEEEFYFARLGREFRRGDSGFESNQPVSIFMRGREGKFTAPHAETELTVHHPGIAAVSLDGDQVTPLAAGEGWLRFSVPAGDHAITIEDRATADRRP